MQMIPRINISYAPGAYGNYIKWILYSLLIDEPLVSPFKESTSHSMDYISQNSLDLKLFHIDLCESVDIVAKDKHRVTLMHPRQSIEDDCFNITVEKVSTLVDYVLVPYFDTSSDLLGLHNMFYKGFRKNKLSHEQTIDRKDLEKGWGVDPEQPIESVDRWIIREHASLTLVENYKQFAGFDLRAIYNISNCKPLLISELFYDFLPTIESIRKFLQVEWTRDPQELVSYHRTNVKNQTYKNQDRIVRMILDSVFDNTDFEWQPEDITLYTEAYIQRALQHQGIMLQCDGLNDFPTSTKELREVFA